MIGFEICNMGHLVHVFLKFSNVADERASSVLPIQEILVSSSAQSLSVLIEGFFLYRET